jgi:uncharacterized protein
MFSLADLPDKIPLFPLPGALLLPRGRLPLNIFEPRYLSMLDDTLKTSDRLIGMIQPMHSEDEGEAPRLHQIGCVGRLVGFNETPDGRYRVTLAGVSRFRLKVVENGFAPYLRAAVSWPEFERDLGQPEKDDGFERDAFLASLGRFFKATGMNSDWESLEKADNELLINSLSMMFPFEIEDKQALLEAPTLQDRRETLVALMEFAMAAGPDGGLLQ